MDFPNRFGLKVSQYESIIGYTFKSKILCAEALNAAADPQAVYTMNSFFNKMPKIDRLAIYGDAAAACHLCNLWVQQGLDKHCWTTFRHQFLGNDNLGGVGMSLDLDACINANGGTTRITIGMVATALEAVLGAVERDGGHDALASVMDHLGLTRHPLLSSSPRGCPEFISCMGTLTLIRDGSWKLGLLFLGEAIKAGTIRLRMSVKASMREITPGQPRGLNLLVHEESSFHPFARDYYFTLPKNETWASPGRCCIKVGT